VPASEPWRDIRRPRILCVGIAVLDQVFRVAAYPRYDDKTTACDFASVVGGGAANAAITIARLGGEARFAGPLGGRGGEDPTGERIVASLAGEGVDCSGCVRLTDTKSPVSAIVVDAQGGRTIIHHRDPRLRAAKPADPDQLVADVDAVLADDHYPEFAAPVCAAARRRALPVVLDIEKPAASADPLFAAATHRVFSRAGLVATTGLAATAGADDLAAALARLSGSDGGRFCAVTDGASPIHWRAGARRGRVPAFAVAAVDTLAAGDVFHGAFALALLERGDAVAALRFAAAAAAIKCMRFGGGAAAPRRPEVERFLGDAAP
jgi:sugar/nucleoside kinase (ribokinase family)